MPRPKRPSDMSPTDRTTPVLFALIFIALFVVIGVLAFLSEG